MRDRARGRKPPIPPRAPNLLLPRAGECVHWPEWWWRELREGGFLQQYLAREKREIVPRQIAETARAERNFEQNRRSEFRRLASLPARLYFRWQQEDPHFWEDRSNYRRLKRDNPELAIWL